MLPVPIGQVLAGVEADLGTLGGALLGLFLGTFTGVLAGSVEAGSELLIRGAADGRNVGTSPGVTELTPAAAPQGWGNEVAPSG